MTEIQMVDVILAVLFCIILVFNIAGNSLVIYIIFNEQGMKTSTNYLLLNLAVADILFGVFLVPDLLFLPFLGNTMPDGVLGEWLCKLLTSRSNVSWMASKASLFTMVCLSVERYFAICHPHVFRHRFSLKNVKILVLSSWVYAIIVMAPIFTLTLLDRKTLFCVVMDKNWIKIHSAYVLVESVCFLILMMFFLIKICISLWCKQTVEPTGQREITERKKKRKVTLCVFAVLITSVVCWIPPAINYAVSALTLASINHAKMLILSLLASANAALDPYLFSFQSSRYKRLVKNTLLCGKAS